MCRRSARGWDARSRGADRQDGEASDSGRKGKRVKRQTTNNNNNFVSSRERTLRFRWWNCFASAESLFFTSRPAQEMPNYHYCENLEKKKKRETCIDFPVLHTAMCCTGGTKSNNRHTCDLKCQQKVVRITQLTKPRWLCTFAWTLKAQGPLKNVCVCVCAHVWPWVNLITRPHCRYVRCSYICVGGGESVSSLPYDLGGGVSSVLVA